jgi:hypothetical protein
VQGDAVIMMCELRLKFHCHCFTLEFSRSLSLTLSSHCFSLLPSDTTGTGLVCFFYCVASDYFKANPSLRMRCCNRDVPDKIGSGNGNEEVEDGDVVDERTRLMAMSPQQQQFGQQQQQQQQQENQEVDSIMVEGIRKVYNPGKKTQTIAVKDLW